ncbi:hypothetical protein AAG906_020445 [Vitis piasezkii]
MTAFFCVIACRLSVWATHLPPYLQPSATGYIDVWEHSGGDRRIDVDWSPIIEDLYSPELGFMDVCATMTTIFHDMMHRDVEVYVDDMIMKSRDRSDHLATLERFFERIRQFRLRLNPKNERGIETDPYKIRAILDMLAPRTERNIKGFLGRLQYISRFIRKSQPTVWDDQCQRAFERIKEYLLSPPVLVPPSLGRLLLLYLSVSNVALGCMLAQLDDLGKK